LAEPAIRTEVLPGGLAILTEHLPWVRSVALGLQFSVGGRADPDGAAGTCHMIEHMIFKGTAERDAIAINVAAESHGAELNAFTDKESTCFYGRFPGDQRGPVTGLLTEIVAGPAFREEEIDREREVISEEIRSGDEDPDSRCATLLFRAVWGDAPRGRPIAGTLESVAGLTRPGLVDFYSRQFHAPHCVAVAAGDIDHEELKAALSGILAPSDPSTRSAQSTIDNSSFVTRASSLPPAPSAQSTIANRKSQILSESRRELSQAYVCLGLPAFDRADPRRYALGVLNTALGGGVSSRLFQRLREREALVYSVSSFTELFSDSGLLGVYFVTDARKLTRCVAVLREELTRARADGFTAEEFERARNMTKSSVLLAMESPATRMLRLARTWQNLGRVLTVDETLDGYNRLVLDDVNRLVAELLAREHFWGGAVGPASESEFTSALAG
jgi:predicted Zn-dependent peptidase